jgi:sugar phosphate isomerase/epimerase
MNTSRRTFLLTSAAALLAKAPAGGWKNHIGLELYTVRDLLAKDFEGTIAKVAEIGYTEVEPVGYGNLDPKQFRALLGRYKLTAPSTHAGVDAGPGMEKQLEERQIMGIQYTEVHFKPAPGMADAEAVKRTAALYNEQGKTLKKFGMKALIHNHTQEYEFFKDSKLRPQDVLLAETDPATVTMQLDIGWASVAGQNILEMFKKNPGRFELWHVKDATGIKGIDPALGPNDRRKATKLTTVGSGDIDYKPIFAKADQAGLKHFCIEQDNAAEGGADSLANARTSFVYLKKLLS